MDQLDLLKKSWKSTQNNYPKYSDHELYTMLHKKSTSVVKWILLISILELLLLSALDFYMSKNTDNDEALKQYHIIHFINALDYVHYCIIAGFVYLFYVNFKKINVVDNLKNLMANILFVKKITNYYIIYNLTLITVVCFVYITAALLYDPEIQQLENYEDRVKMYVGVGIGLTIFSSVLIGTLYFIYKLIYGRLIKKLTQNYQELKKLHV